MDGVNLSTDELYRRLKDSSQFPKTSLLFDEYENVVVFDSKLAVGGIRFLVDEALKYQDEPMEFVVEKLNQLVPRIVIAAMPETLDYLLAGGRLSKSSWMVGKLLSIIPIISFINGRVEVLLKKRGIKQCMRTVVDMIRMLPEDYQNAISVYDDLCSSIACHWGPNAFGFIYVNGIDVV